MILGLLYSTQTVPIAFMGTALPAIMRMEGVSLKNITYLSLVTIPSTVKFLWAPLVDRYGKRYFTWVTIFTILYVAFFLPAMFLQVHQILALGVLFTLAMTCMSVQDIAMDAFAIRSLSLSQRAIGNGIQTGGNYLGLLLGGGVLLLFYEKLGWRNAILILSLVTVLPIVTTIRYAGASTKTSVSKKITCRDLFTYFREKEHRSWAPVLMLLLIPANMAFGFSNPMLIDNGFKLEQVGYMFGLCGGGATIVSGFLSGVLLRSLSIRAKLLTAVLCSIICVMAALLLQGIAPGQEALAVFYCIIMGLMAGANTMVINDVSMYYVRKGKEGTDYSIQLFLRYLVYTPVIISGGAIIEDYGYGALFYGVLAIALVIGGIVLNNFKREKTGRYAL